MSLNIKNEQTCRLAAELADLTGETMTGAITVSLQERLDRIRKHKQAADVEHIVQQVLQMVRGIRASSPGGSSDHSDLYDEWGLPC